MKVNDIHGNQCNCYGFMVRSRYGSVGTFKVYGILVPSLYHNDLYMDFDDEDTFSLLYESASFGMALEYRDLLTERLVKENGGVACQ